MSASRFSASLALCGLVLALSACAIEPPAAPLATRPEAPAGAAIFGRSAYAREDGESASCAGQSVALMRDTPAMRARMVALYGSDQRARLEVSVVKARSTRLGPAPEGSLAASEPCDASGGFAFRRLAAGSYFVIARIRERGGAAGEVDLVVMRRISLEPGENRTLSLTP